MRHNYSCLSQECLLSVVLYMYVFVGWCVCYCVFPFHFLCPSAACTWNGRPQVVHSVPCVSPAGSKAEEMQLNRMKLNRISKIEVTYSDYRYHMSNLTVSRGQGYFMIKKWCWSVYFLTGGSGGWTPDPALRSRHPPSPLLQWHGKFHQRSLMIVR